MPWRNACFFVLSEPGVTASALQKSADSGNRLPEAYRLRTKRRGNRRLTRAAAKGAAFSRGRS